MKGKTNVGDWSPDEDEWLCYAKSIANKWTKIAEIVGTRKYAACDSTTRTHAVS